jgi:hypothetical protein
MRTPWLIKGAHARVKNFEAAFHVEVHLDLSLHITDGGGNPELATELYKVDHLWLNPHERKCLCRRHF